MHLHDVHAVVEIADNAADGADHTISSIKAIAGPEAFRKYQWLANAPMKNVSGNFRGMVVSRRWATAFHFAEGADKYVGPVAAVAALADNIFKSSYEINWVLNSNADDATKAARISSQISSICLRTLGGAIPSTGHLLALSLEGYCQIAGLLGVPKAQRAVDRLRSYDVRLSSTFDIVTDGDNIYTFVTNHLVLR